MDAGLTRNGQKLNSWAFRRKSKSYMREQLRKSTSVPLLDTNIVRHFFLGYPYTLYRWNGSNWVKANMKTYSGTTWMTEVLKLWDGSEWKEVNNTGN